MATFLLRRFLIMIPTVLIISVISFVLIQLPPGDFLTTIIREYEEIGRPLTRSEIARLDGLRELYGLDRPVYVQYFKWIGGVLRGNFGYSFEYNRAVSDIIASRIGMTLIVSVASLIFTWVVAFPIGFYSAVKQYSIGDNVFTLLGFLGLAIPNFLLALVLLFLAFTQLGVTLGGLNSREFLGAPMSWAKFVDMLPYLVVPMIVIGTAGTASLIRVMRNNLLDELQKPYVIMARSKGLSEIRLLLKYPVRIAINPFLSTAGWLLPMLFSGQAITAVVLSLPTMGPVLLEALMAQDMYLAGSIVFIMALLTIVGTVISDILLAVADPRIRYD